MKNKSIEYKFRAELHEHARLIHGILRPGLLRWNVDHVTVVHRAGMVLLPDVEVEFTMAEGGPGRGELQWLIAALDGCDVASQTLARVENYTGVRVPLEEKDCIPREPDPRHIPSILAAVDRMNREADEQVELVRYSTGLLLAMLEGPASRALPGWLR